MANVTTARSSKKSAVTMNAMKAGTIAQAERLGLEILYRGDDAYGFVLGGVEYTKATQVEKLISFFENKWIPGLPTSTRKVNH